MRSSCHKITLAAAIALTIGSTAHAQMSEGWIRTLPGTPTRLLRATDGDLIVPASIVVPSTIGGAAFYDSTLTRYGPDGTLRWTWQSNETQIDRFTDAALDDQSNIYAVGILGTSFWGQQPFVARIIKFSPTGQRLWTAPYTPGRAGFDTAPEGIRIAPDGGIVIFGQDYGVTTQRDIFIARYSPSGTHQWTFRRAGSVWDFVFDITFDEQSNAYWVGSSFREGTALNGGCLGKLTPGGQEAWTWVQPVEANVGGALSRVSFDREGNLIATGHSEQFPGYQDGVLVKLSREGQQIFFRTWDGPDARWDRFFTHTVLSDNSIAVSGDTYAGDGAEYYDVPTIRFSPGGDVLWTNIYGSTLYYPNDTEEWSLNMFTLPGDQVLTISTDWARPGYDYALHRYSRDGELLERVVRVLPAGLPDIKDIPPGCAVLDSESDALYLLGWGAGPPTDPLSDHLTLIRINLPGTSPSCVADMDDGTGSGTPDGGVTIDDLLFYLGVYDAGATRADVDNGSGLGTPDGGVTIDDLLYYLDRFSSGC
jgi:hypothetical protein